MREHRMPVSNAIGNFASFGPFRLFPAARVLERDGVAVCLGSRALDILIALVERAGEIVDHRELISRVWRGLVVEPGNLRVQVTHLRKCLGDGEKGVRYIANVPGQGYSFVAAITGPACRDRAELADSSAGLSGEAVAFPAIRLFTQTFDALLDWSRKLLPDSERLVLRKLSILAGSFTLETALAIACEEELDATRVVRAIEHLAAMTFLSTTITENGIRRYRLVGAARAIAFEQCVSSGLPVKIETTVAA